MTLKDYILTYEVDDKIVVNLFDYYEYFIKPLDERFKNYSYYSSDLVLCFFKDHADINPSMGHIKSKKFKNVRVCHCFGCHRTADVVRLHQIISSQYHNKELTEKEACLDLAQKFNVPLDDFDELDDEDYEAKYIRQLRNIEKLSNRYTIREFSRGLKEIRGSETVDLNKVNSECVKMIATVKQLYS